MTDQPRYVVFEIPPEVTDRQADIVMNLLMGFGHNLGEVFDMDLFVMRPHSNQEQILNRLFNEPASGHATGVVVPQDRLEAAKLYVKVSEKLDAQVPLWIQRLADHGE